MQEYTVTTPSGVTYTAQLDEDEAKRMDAKPVSTKQTSTTKNKARKSTSNKSKD